LQESRAFRGGADIPAAGVLRIIGNVYETAAREPGHDAAHGGRFDLLRRGEFLQRLRPSEHKHRKRREAGRTFSSGNVLLADKTQKMDGGGVQVIGDLDRGSGGELLSRLTFALQYS